MSWYLHIVVSKVLKIKQTIKSVRIVSHCWTKCSVIKSTSSGFVPHWDQIISRTTPQRITVLVMKQNFYFVQKLSNCARISVIRTNCEYHNIFLFRIAVRHARYLIGIKRWRNVSREMQYWITMFRSVFHAASINSLSKVGGRWGLFSSEKQDQLSDCSTLSRAYRCCEQDTPAFKLYLSASCAFMDMCHFSSYARALQRDKHELAFLHTKKAAGRDARKCANTASVYLHVNGNIMYHRRDGCCRCLTATKEMQNLTKFLPLVLL